MPKWDELVEVLNRLPRTWIPAVLLIVVELAVKAKCFKPGGLKTAIDQKLTKMELDEKGSKGI